MTRAREIIRSFHREEWLIFAAMLATVIATPFWVVIGGGL